MQRQEILKRADGSRVQISVSIGIDFMNIYPTVIIDRCEPGKKKFRDVRNSNDYAYRALDMPERRKAVMVKNLEYVTKEEINKLFRELVEEIYNKAAIK